MNKAPYLISPEQNHRRKHKFKWKSVPLVPEVNFCTNFMPSLTHTFHNSHHIFRFLRNGWSREISFPSRFLAGTYFTPLGALSSLLRNININIERKVSSEHIFAKQEVHAVIIMVTRTMCASMILIMNWEDSKFSASWAHLKRILGNVSNLKD
jgi:hypothetical protein